MSNIVLIVESALLIGGIGLMVGIVLIWASKKFAVETDPLVDKINEILPGANCGACGYAGCADFAEKVVEEIAAVSDCPLCDFEVTKEIAMLVGKEVTEEEPTYPIVLCNGGVHCIDKVDYVGIDDCRAVMMISDGEKGCKYGCMGRGTCVRACPFDAIWIGDDRLPHVNKNLCKSCALCIDECPTNILVMAKESERTHIFCLSHDKGKAVKAVCEFGCTGCRRCVKACPEEAIIVTNFLATIDQEKCTNCGKCIEECKQNTIIMAHSGAETIKATA